MLTHAGNNQRDAIGVEKQIRLAISFCLLFQIRND